MTLRRLALLLAAVSTASIVACSQATDAIGDGDDDEGEEATSGAGGHADDDLGGPSGPASSGAGNATSSGEGGSGQSSAATTGSGGEGTSTASSGTGGSSSCAHDLCEEGVLLDPSCDPCVATICAVDSYCCDTEWDTTCIDEVASECTLDVCGGGNVGIGEGDLIITEIMNNPKVVTDANGEWFELYNASANDVDLNGLVIRHQEGDPTAVHTIASSVIVPSGGYAVLGINGDGATNGGIAVAYAYGESTVNLGNTTDLLAIETTDGTVIDQTSWTELSGLDPDGASRNLDAASMSALDNDDDANFCVATATISGSTDKGTPGAANTACP